MFTNFETYHLLGFFYFFPPIPNIERYLEFGWVEITTLEDKEQQELAHKLESSSTKCVDI
jgi:hypothetical protein